MRHLILLLSLTCLAFAPVSNFSDMADKLQRADFECRAIDRWIHMSCGNMRPTGKADKMAYYQEMAGKYGVIVSACSCGEYIGVKNGKGIVGISHSLCEVCVLKMLEEAKEYKEAQRIDINQNREEKGA